MFFYCLGIRLDGNYKEQTCKMREQCPYYTNANLGAALSHPEQYQELDTYNSDECKIFNKLWQQKQETCETSESQTDGMTTLLKQGSSR